MTKKSDQPSDPPQPAEIHAQRLESIAADATSSDGDLVLDMADLEAIVAGAAALRRETALVEGAIRDGYTLRLIDGQSVEVPKAAAVRSSAPAPCFRRCSLTQDRKQCADESGLMITECQCDCHDAETARAERIDPMTDAAILKRLDELALRIEHLDKERVRVREVLGNTIAWIAQSAGSPLSVTNAKILLDDLHKGGTP